MTGLYNVINGVQPSTWFILPMLGKHPDEYPRFRDCFVGKMWRNKEKDEYGIPVWHHGKEQLISVYTRVGGNNRPDYQKEIEIMKKMSEYVEDFDDDFDNTFAIFVFRVPDKFKKDFDYITKGESLISGISKELQKQINKVYPKLKDKMPWNKKKVKKGIKKT